MTLLGISLPGVLRSQPERLSHYRPVMTVFKTVKKRVLIVEDLIVHHVIQPLPYTRAILKAAGTAGSMVEVTVVAIPEGIMLLKV